MFALDLLRSIRTPYSRSSVHPSKLPSIEITDEDEKVVEKVAKEEITEETCVEKCSDFESIERETLDIIKELDDFCVSPHGSVVIRETS